MTRLLTLGSLRHFTSHFTNLRDHPLVYHRGIRSWPPIWTPRGPSNSSAGKGLRGEVGVLKRVLRHRAMPNACFLIIEHEGESWIGTLMIDDREFCAQIAEILQSHVGHSIKEIGGIDLSFTL